MKAGLEALLRAEFDLAPTAETADVCVVDADFSDGVPGEVPVVALSTGNPAELLRQGYVAVLEPDASAAELTAAVRAAAAGLVTLDRATLNGLLAGGERVAAAASVDAHLTPREHEVLRLLAAGLVNKEIAGRLGISDHTAKFHVASVLQKLHASSRAEAVAIGMRAGLILL